MMIYEANVGVQPSVVNLPMQPDQNAGFHATKKYANATRDPGINMPPFRIQIYRSSVYVRLIV